VVGFVYWIVAAHLFSTASIGRTSVLVSIMFLVMELASMGMGLGLAYILPTMQQEWARVVNSAMLAVVFSSAVVSLVLISGAAILHVKIGESVTHSSSLLVVFVSTCTMWTVSIVIDQILTIERATGLVLFRSIMSSLVRLMLLPVAGRIGSGDPVVGLFGSWGLSAAASTLLVMTLYIRMNPSGRRLSRHLDTRVIRQILPLSLTNHLLSVSDVVPGLLLPLIVSQFLSSDANAYFYMAWMTAVGLYTIPVSISKVLFARLATQTDLSSEIFTKVLGATLGVVVVLTSMVIIARNLILSLFGSAYVARSSSLLLVLACTAIPVTICSLYIGAARIRRTFGRGFAVTLSVVVVLLTIIGPLSSRYGLLGVGLAFCGSYATVGIACLVDLSRTRYHAAHQKRLTATSLVIQEIRD